MKTVLMISPLPWNIGGVEKRITEIARNIDEQIELVVVSSSAKNEEVGLHEWNGIKVIVLRRTRFFPYYPLGLFSYLRKNRDNIDLLDLQGLKTIEPIIFLLSNMKKPFIITPHHHAKASNKLLQLIKLFYDPIVSKRLLEKSRLIICVSDIEKELILNEFGRNLQNKMSVISNGINLKEIRSAEPFNEDGCVILYAGRLEKYKNIQNVIQSMNYLPKKYHLYIIGEGSYRKSLEKIVEETHLNGQVTFLGRVSEGDLYRWLRTSKVFVNLSDLEAFGISVLEALAAGARAIVNNKYGLAETAEKFPATVVPVDVRGISPRAIANIIEGLSPAEEENLSGYDWSRIAADINNAYLAMTN
jgi:glycosyltransferase involved in cell wall biosynthesis